MQINGITQKKFSIYKGVLQSRFLGGYIHQEDVQRILLQPLSYDKGLIELTTNLHAQILTHIIHSQNSIL